MQSQGNRMMQHVFTLYHITATHKSRFECETINT